MQQQQQQQADEAHQPTALQATQPVQEGSSVSADMHAGLIASEHYREGQSQQQDEVGGVGDAHGDSLLSTNDFMKVTLSHWGQEGEAAAEPEAGQEKQG
jgi:hypothetical protein